MATPHSGCRVGGRRGRHEYGVHSSAYSGGRSRPHRCNCRSGVRDRHALGCPDDRAQYAWRRTARALPRQHSCPTHRQRSHPPVCRRARRLLNHHADLACSTRNCAPRIAGNRVSSRCRRTSSHRMCGTGHLRAALLNLVQSERCRAPSEGSPGAQSWPSVPSGAEPACPSSSSCNRWSRALD